MTIRLAAPLALLILSCAASANAAANDAHPEHSGEQAPTEEVKPEKQRKVCRTETATGSVMPKRVCRTVAQMEEEQRNAERFREQQNRMGASAR